MSKNESKGKVLFWISAITAIVLIVTSYLLPPTGVIEKTVLEAVGWLFSFAALGVVLAAIENGIGAKMTRGDTVIQIGDEDARNDD